MIFFILRAMVVVGVIVGVYFIVKSIIGSSDFITCGRCEGKGFWYDARGKETCDWCKGSGKLPKQ